MEYKLILTEDYNIDVNEIAEYYTLLKNKTEERFLRDIIKDEETVLKNPFAYAAREEKFRRKNMKIFPFCIFYSVDEKRKEVALLRCIHQHRDPHVWP